MVGLGLLLGHMVGDYVAQNDWMARNKTKPWPSPKPEWPWRFGPAPREGGGMSDEDWGKWRAYDADVLLWRARWRVWWEGSLACTVHCALYTLAVWCFAWWWLPWWGLVLCFLAHWAVDRFRLALWWMERVAGQKEFAAGPLSPWSVVVVDNVFHLLTLWGIAWLSGVL